MFALRTTLEDRGGVSLQSSGLVCLLSRVKKIKASPRQRLQVYSVQPTIKAWGFPKPGSSPVACPTGGRSHLACSATLWNWDLGNKHRTMMILQLLLLLRRVCVCVHTCVCVCVRTGTHEHSRSVAQSCPNLHGPVECSPPGSSVRGIFQARILEWVAISYSRESSQSRDRTLIPCVTFIGRRILCH